jgi:hypothetical protein
METGISCEREHEFTLVLSGIDDFNANTMNALFEAGCDDATPSLRFGRVHLAFARTAKTMREAIISAIRDVYRSGIGAGVARIDECNLVTQAEIGRRSGRSRQVINQYIKGQRGPGKFPKPACEITEGVSLWLWCEVAYWLRQNGMIPEEDSNDAQDINTLNVILEFLSQERQDPDFFNEVIRLISPAGSRPSGQPV